MGAGRTEIIVRNPRRPGRQKSVLSSIELFYASYSLQNNIAPRRSVGDKGCMTRQFFIPGLRHENTFGGIAAKGKRKERRPIATKRSMHLVLKSSLAVGKYSLLQKQNSRFISELVARLSRQWRVRIYSFSNNGNHLHLLIQAQSRKGLQAFMRTLSALVARKVSGARKGKSLSKKFWDAIPFTRIVEWGKAFFFAKNYVRQNQLEAMGYVPHAPRSKAVPWRLDSARPLS